MQDSATTLASSPLDAAARDALITRWQQIKKTLPMHVTLLAVSKTKPSDMIRILAAEGQGDFGENYVQEAISKITELSASLAVSSSSAVWAAWVLIGKI